MHGAPNQSTHSVHSVQELLTVWIIHACAQACAHTEEWIASYKEMERSSKIKEEGIRAEGHFLRSLTAGETPAKSIWKGKKWDGGYNEKGSPVTPPQPPPPHASIRILQFLKWNLFPWKKSLHYIIFTRGRGRWRAFLSPVGLLEDPRPTAFSTTGLTLTQTH